MELEDYVEGKTQYLILDPPIETQVLRISLQSGSNVKCLRAELYGCGYNKRTLEYYRMLLSLLLLFIFVFHFFEDFQFLSIMGKYISKHSLGSYNSELSRIQVR